MTKELKQTNNTTTLAPMIRSMKDLIGYPVDEKDGNLGKVKDFLFDDKQFKIRYMVADTGSWLSSHKVLISTLHLCDPDMGEASNHFPVNLTKEEVENCPPLDSDAPVSRQYEEAFAKHYAQAPYWTESSMIGRVSTPLTPEELALDPNYQTDDVTELMDGDPHLRSFKETLSYDISATDGEIGHIHDFIVECGTWQLRYVVVDTHRWLPGGKVMFAVDWLEDINYRDSSAKIDLTKSQIEAGPRYDAAEAVNEDYQRNLYDYYGKPYRETPAVTPF